MAQMHDLGEEVSVDYRKLAWLRRLQSDGPVYSKIHLFLPGGETALCGLWAGPQLRQGNIIAQPGPGLDLPMCRRCLKASLIIEKCAEAATIVEFDGKGVSG